MHTPSARHGYEFFIIIFSPPPPTTVHSYRGSHSSARRNRRNLVAARVVRGEGGVFLFRLLLVNETPRTDTESQKTGGPDGFSLGTKDARLMDACKKRYRLDVPPKVSFVTCKRVSAARRWMFGPMRTVNGHGDTHTRTCFRTNVMLLYCTYVYSQVIFINDV